MSDTPGGPRSKGPSADEVLGRRLREIVTDDSRERRQAELLRRSEVLEAELNEVRRELKSLSSGDASAAALNALIAEVRREEGMA